MIKENYIWVEKYRPDSLKTYIGNPHLKEKLKTYISEQDLPHLLFSGKPGTGKTTAAKMLINSIDCDSLFINASDENNIETVRSKIKGFASSIGFKALKIIVLDECDYITPQAQAALRNMMEVFSKTTRFILTANYKERIIDAIVSRTQVFDIVPPSKKEVAMHVSSILQSEDVEFTAKAVSLIINAYYPDIRLIINTCQNFTKNGKLEVVEEKLAENDYKTAIVETLKSADAHAPKFTAIRQIIADSQVRDFAQLYRVLYDSVLDYAPNNAAEVIVAISEGVYRDSLVVDKEINMMATIVNILEIVK